MKQKNRFKSRRRSSQNMPTPAQETSGNFEFGTIFRMSQMVLLVLLLALAATLLIKGGSPLDGGVVGMVFRAAGGGIVLVLLHFIYGLLCSLMERQVSSVFRQWLGTFSLYVAVGLLLGMLQKSGLGGAAALLSPGFVGGFMASALTSVFGAVGAILAGLVLVLLSAYNYGHLKADRFAVLRSFFSRLRMPSLPRWHHKKDESDDDSEIYVPSSGERSSEQKEADAGEVESELPFGGAYRRTTNMASDAAVDRKNDSGAKDSIFKNLAAAFGVLLGRSSRSTAGGDWDRRAEDEDDLQTEWSRDKNARDVIMDMNSVFPDETPHFPERHSPASVGRQEQAREEAQAQPQWEFHRHERRRPGEVLEGASPAQQPVAERTAAPTAETPRSLNPQAPRPAPAPQTSTTRIKTTEEAEKVPLSKQPTVEEAPTGALDGTDEVEYVGSRAIPVGSFPPPLELLGPHKDIVEAVDDAKAQANGHAVVKALSDFGVTAELKRTIIGPTVVQYQIQLAPGIKVSKVSALGNDIAVALGVASVRVEAPIPGTSYIGIELPNTNRRAVPLRQILESDVFRSTKLKLPLPLGQTVDGRILISGLEELPHLLIAGTTGSGKSIFVNNCIVAMCWHNTPEQLRFIMVDPKRVEMGIYESLPHILAKPIVTSTGAVHALAWAVREMERRLDMLSLVNVRSLASYNEKVLPKDRLPHIVIIIDELADLMMTAQKEVEDYIMRLAQMARAVGIHLMLATQRPSVNVLTGTIKANIPARVSFSLPTVADSRTIIDVSGAQNLLGKGDMLFVGQTKHPLRIQSPFMDEQTNIRIVEYLRSTFGDPEYVDLDEQSDEKGGGKAGDYLEDNRLEEAIKIVLGTGVASSSGLQRQMRIGFTRAARMIDTMEAMGIVGPQNGAKPREILVDEAEALEILDQHRG